MTGASRGRRRNGSDCTIVLRAPMVTLLAWATVAFVSVALERVSAAPSRPGMEAITSPPVDPGRVAGPICWETQGLYERDCFHDEPLTADTYPLTYEMLERASSRYTTTGLSLNRAFQKGRKRGELKIMVLGGSVTAGHDCRSPAGLSGKDCAWPHRLQQWCDERIDDVTVEVRKYIILERRLVRIFNCERGIMPSC